jgi:uncharacterized coiled-coil protein SlyX
LNIDNRIDELEARIIELEAKVRALAELALQQEEIMVRLLKTVELMRGLDKADPDWRLR